MKRKNKKRTWPFVIMFIVGFLVLMYPLVSQYYYRIEANEQIVEFETKRQDLDSNEILRRIELARAYNDTLDPSRLADPYTDREKEGISEYARMLEVGEKVGYVEIPKIDTNIPIYAGTSESILQKGAGHLEGTSLPIGGESTHTVITAHRGLPTAELFRNLNKLKEGDVFYLHNIETALAYEVDQILTVEPSDFEPVLVQDKKDYATLLTCTPYMINSHRLLVRGHRIPYVPPVDDGVADSLIVNMSYRDLLMFEIPVAILTTALALYYRSEVGKKRKKLESLKQELGDLDDK